MLLGSEMGVESPISKGLASVDGHVSLDCWGTDKSFLRSCLMSCVCCKNAADHVERGNKSSQDFRQCARSALLAS